MTDTNDRHEIAARIRALLNLPSEDIAATARHLGVEELSLRMSVDDRSPYPTLDVIVAVVQHTAVDPSYLLTGRYDVALHRTVVDADRSTIAATVAEYVRPVIRPRVS